MHATFQPSLLRCLSNIHFLEHFYDTFLASSPEVARAFAGADMERQMAMLNASLYQLMNLYEKRDEVSRAHVAALGAAHGHHGHQIPMALYDLWLESLVDTVRRCDPRFEPAIETAWRDVMSYGIELMKAHWNAVPPPTSTHERQVVEAVVLEQLAHQLAALGQEASHRSDVERDSEASAFQFGQYRAYLHASQVVHELLAKNG